ncbi:MAG: Gfo/Idh/MocA family oxidoreductase [Pirellulales bacterium]|nr:Gfo/Idh/MocA family oxidoreductase [Pirellulales bacterium]
MSTKMTRRRMLRNASLAGVGFVLSGGRANGQDRSPNNKLNVAFVGAGGQAQFSLEGLASENIVALCDVDERRASGAFRQHPKARRYRDFRKMLDQMDKQIEAVVVCTPDHVHAPASIRAMRMGKHVYCEKPLTWSIEEARLMAREAKKNKVATQMGTQGMAVDGARAGVEVLRSGVLGPVREMHVWTDRAQGWWPQGVDRPKETPPIPDELQWDLWLGPALERPYHPAYVPFNWRGWKDFGTGAIGDMGIHNAAMPFVGLELGLPISAEIVNTSGLSSETFPAWSMLRIEFPARGSLPPVTLHWYDGGKKPSSDLIGGQQVADNGAILVGEQGTLYSVEWTGGDWHLLPEDKFRDWKPPAATVPRSAGHHQEWIAACKGGPAAFCNFIDFAAPLTEIMLLGCLAQRAGRKIEWDALNMRATNWPPGDVFIRREYRKGWEL